MHECVISKHCKKLLPHLFALFAHCCLMLVLLCFFFWVFFLIFWCFDKSAKFVASDLDSPNGFSLRLQDKFVVCYLQLINARTTSVFGAADIVEPESSVYLVCCFVTFDFSSASILFVFVFYFILFSTFILCAFICMQTFAQMIAGLFRRKCPYCTPESKETQLNATKTIQFIPK